MHMSLRHVVLSALDDQPASVSEVYELLAPVIGEWWGLDKETVRQILIDAARKGFVDRTAPTRGVQTPS